MRERRNTWRIGCHERVVRGIERWEGNYTEKVHQCNYHNNKGN